MLEPVVPSAFHPLRLVRRYWLPALLVIGLLGYVANWLVFKAFNDQGYAPRQPLAFSHKQHAGDLGLSCMTCHSNAERGKHASVPATETCMGCHNEVKIDSPEIMRLATIAKEGNYTEVSADGTNSTVIKQGGAVHWNRVHKLPDHVYFNHKWHVQAGIDCTTCHGPVQTMVVMRQYSDLSMGWCLDCHRKDTYVTKLASSATVGLAAADAFTVGVADYAVVRARSDNELDSPAHFHERELKGAPVAFGPSASASEGNEHEAKVLPAHLNERLQRLLGEVPEYRKLPPRKVIDLPPQALPESHRAFYTTPDAYHNAATQCSTCHQ